MIKLTHKYTHLFEDFFANPKYTASLKDVITGMRTYAIKLAADELHINRKEAVKTDEFRLYYGALGEVFCEFWMRMFAASELRLSNVFDTSANQFCRGFDFTASSLFNDSLLALIQVKMRKDELKTFMRHDLATLFDEASRHGVLPQHLILMVPTSSLSRAEILSYKEGFAREATDRMVFVGYQRMLKAIQSLPSTRELIGVQEFITSFKESVTASKIVTT